MGQSKVGKVDLRPGSATYGKWYSILLTAENRLQFLISRFFAHGFLVLTDTAWQTAHPFA